ncbi:1-deoxy-D-xylulose 5-phosphate synthase, putative [Plasmodium gallinaceum]|uniref:1-deoxy-D-xylulose-5-phosphate synthase n=1 Tax=Plasmodium gallinaceum TaxID=5849 RepID=A0A1J1GRM8_PLAGA|nr:1-deoxy-D-xylulose 5-phosphate synthase, putative [Plasmodium gallinaceum]CRG95082.1 1-deoxy-D-xylulose 5-phosphate synthase, putative [Plasmodium gallinaceum]
MINIFNCPLYLIVLYLLILIVINSNGVNIICKTNKNQIYRKKLSKLKRKNYLSNINCNLNSLSNIANYNIHYKRNKSRCNNVNKLYSNNINNNKNLINSFYHSHNKGDNKGYNKYNSNEVDKEKCLNNSKILFINYFNFKHLGKHILKKNESLCNQKELSFPKSYKKYYSKLLKEKSLFNSQNILGTKEADLCPTCNNDNNINDISKLEYEEELNNEKKNIDIYINKINSFLNIEEYKDIYGKEVYNEIIKLYIEKKIPENYEKIYFSEDVKKSVIFDMNKYDDKEFEKMIEEEFKNNGIFINNIDKKYYRKENILGIKKILNYLPLLNLINNPSDLKKLKEKYLPLLAHELKIFLFFIVNITGGHFSSSLSLLEIQLLLLYIFNQPYDDVIYDIGHQAYIHKILTGRKFLFFSLRKKKGLSGFLSIFESIYDKFGAGHSSTSLSAIQGFYESDWQVYDKEKKNSPKENFNDAIMSTSFKKESPNNGENFNITNMINDVSFERNNSDDLDKFHIAIIGDGGLTGGMALEALNYISFLNSKVLIIYNDNGEVSLPTNTLSISGVRPIGSISDHLHSFVTNKIKNKNTTSNIKGKNIFENLNYNYIGVVDGNNINEMYNVLTDIKKNKIKKSTVLHVHTRKSSKFIDLKSPINKMHSIKKNELFSFDMNTLIDNNKRNYINENDKKGYIKEEKEDNKENNETGYKEGDKLFVDINNEMIKQNNNECNDIDYEEIFDKKTFTDIYLEEMLKYLKKDQNIIFISPAMLGGSGLVKIGELYPKNVYDVGISEQHAVTFSAAMAKNKKLKIHLCIYSTFLQRAYDQLIHDMNLQKLPLKVIICRSGLVGEDGATHQGIYDLSYLGALKNSYIISPSNSIDLKKSLKFSYIDKEHSVFIRLPRLNILNNNYLTKFLHIDIEKEEENDINNFIGKARIIKMSNHNNFNRNKKKVSIFNMGSMLYNVVNALKEIEKDKYFLEEFSFSVIDMIFLNPLDKNIIDYVVKENKHHCLITYEDNVIGGFSTHFNNYLIDNNYINKYNLYVHNIYFPNESIEHGSHKDQQKVLKMDKCSLADRIKSYLINNFT